MTRLPTRPSPLLDRLLSLGGGGGVEDESGAHPLPTLIDRALAARRKLLAGRASLEGAAVVMLVAPGAAFVEAFFGVLLAGGVAVPLSPQYPEAELAWFADDARARDAVVSKSLASKANLLSEGRRVWDADSLGDGPAGPMPPTLPQGSQVATLLYTSGTTGKPKGAMLTHENLAAHTALLRDIWRLTPDDRLLHALPLHHLHGLNVALMTALLAGARARMLPRFDALTVLEALRDATTWMAVPTMYQKLIEAFDASNAASKARFSAHARALRLATSGSAALPVTLATRWCELSGAVPLERYGMTEIGVGTSNPFEPALRRTGTVGMPLPTVEHRIVGDDGGDLADGPGELWIRGPSVFVGYFGRADADHDAFVDGWFRTGDVAVRDKEGYVRLLGRTSVDILKSGGYKLSALEIEESLRENDAVAEVSVVGVPDEVWGDRVVAAVVARPGREADCAEDALRGFAKSQLAAYKVPKNVLLFETLPRNALGKVMKPELVKLVAKVLAKH